jgi:hypothetical protein
MEVDGKNKNYNPNLAQSTGRILDFDKHGFNPDTLLLKINEYFDTNTVIPEELGIAFFNQGKAIVDNTRVFTFPGLCSFIGLESRQRYWDLMRGKTAYSLPLKRGYMRLQSYLETLTMRNGNPAGPMFILKNMDYSDQQTINQTVTNTPVKPEIITQDKETGKEIRKLYTVKDKTGTSE